VRKAGRFLISLGLAREPYPEAMVQCARDYGPYIVIAPGIAIPHARPEEGGLHEGIALIRLENPVSFGHPENDPVDLLFAFTAADSGGHVALMADLAGALADEQTMVALRAAGTPAEAVWAVRHGAAPTSE